MQQFLLKHWQKRGWWAWLTAPLGGLVCLLAGIKRHAYQSGRLQQNKLSVPTIVVGNLSVGGSGKTPLVAELAGQLHEAGYRPGILCRGYKGKADQWPQFVTPDSDPQLNGDEPVMLALQTGCPVMAGPDRSRSAQILIDQHHCDIIISDDGFQHLKLARDIDIVVIDTARGLGNRWCLPSGPLRESSAALKSADMLVLHGKPNTSVPGLPSGPVRCAMQLMTGEIYKLADRSAKLNPEHTTHQRFHAIAGIGHPQRFFASLREHGLEFVEHCFPDHHAYDPSELVFSEKLPLITTEKDAIKLARLQLPGEIWVLPVTARLDAEFNTFIVNKLNTLSPRP